jgi:hypothetical protein
VSERPKDIPPVPANMPPGPPDVLVPVDDIGPPDTLLVPPPDAGPPDTITEES